MSAGRVGSLQRMLRDEAALAEVVPTPLRGLPAGVTRPLAVMGVRRTLRKYAGSASDVAANRGVLIEVLEQLRADLRASSSTGEPKTLLPELSYADMAMAQVVFCISPPKEKVRIGAASRRLFEEPELQERFGDLVAWRDALYRQHRPEPGGSRS
jgi:glutathione S-transferase